MSDIINLNTLEKYSDNKLVYDDKGNPSVMVKIPKMTYSDLGIGDFDMVHPAFIVNGKEIDAIYVSKYQNIVEDERAYSLPEKDPAHNVNLETAIQYCESKGKGWHLITRAEWALLALLCMKNNFLPYGNNDYGKDKRETEYIATPAFKDGEGRTGRILSGTGPQSWSHNNSESGIWDLNSNVWEWVGGVRTVYGELQILENNNAADSDFSQTASSADWKAIDAKTGMLITPSGNGMTKNSVKVNFISEKITYSALSLEQSDACRNCLFADVTCDDTISNETKLLLCGLGLLPIEKDLSKYEDSKFFFNNGAAERSFFCGGVWSCDSGTGIFSINGYYARSEKGDFFGFRSAYIE